ncbi:GFA family protein [Nannocystis punicea]|uniref:GFA family protein n=1 Tax=Nannocystis punicea TaxID=2995304 RepID=A0ABY7GUR3_9BACT|nr:GFA family protein [Nannocystis poenicansa]WAS90564.1 GFA family protein [Nannocystis poenicansa]
MTTRRAACNCGQLHLTCEGEPVRLSMCHCLECQRRTGSVFGVQAWFPLAQVTIAGEATRYRRTGDGGTTAVFHFCPQCGATVYWQPEALPDRVAVAVGAFADPSFPPPRVSVYDERQHPWTERIADLPMEHFA